MSWVTLESDPGLFYELVEKLGASNADFVEMVDIGPQVFDSYPQLHGVIFLYKYSQREAIQDPQDGEYAPDAPIFFARQIVENACATQAVLGVLMNANQVDLGPQLAEFKEFTSEFDSETKGEAIGSSDWLREAHNHMAPPPSLLNPDIEQPPVDEDNDGLYHYISYVPSGGRIYEIDGLRPFPIDHGEYEDLGDKMSDIIQNRISQRAPHELRFSVIAVCGDRQKAYEAAGDTEFASQIQLEREDMRSQNALRRHQYTGLTLELIRQLAAKSSRQEWQKLTEKGRVNERQS